jgi:lipopolysaccharide export LptBFGC system permease protein LptF
LDRASVFGTEGCRFEPYRVQLYGSIVFYVLTIVCSGTCKALTRDKMIPTVLFIFGFLAAFASVALATFGVRRRGKVVSPVTIKKEIATSFSG